MPSSSVIALHEVNCPPRPAWTLGPDVPLVQSGRLDNADDFRRATGETDAGNIFLGVDMATEAGNTALTALAWPAGGDHHPELVAVWKKVNHQVLAQLLNLGSGAYRAVAVDVPFGWPRRFAAMLSEHEEGPLQMQVPGDHDEGLAKLDRGIAATWRTVTLALRATDQELQRLYHMRPFAVSFDKLGATATAWALIEAALRLQLDRTGSPASDGSPRIMET